MQSERETAAVGAFDPLTQHELNGATYESILPYRSRSRSPCSVPYVIYGKMTNFPLEFSFGLDERLATRVAAATSPPTL